MGDNLRTTTNGAVRFSPDQIALIKNTLARDQHLTDDELQLFIYSAQRQGLDPLARQIYAVKRQGKMVLQASIDGYRLIADRTGQYAGNDDPVFDDEADPKKATVTVYKLVQGQRCAFQATARWDQYYPGDRQGFMWKKMPHLMLGKCAEALALRKAFPAEMSGLYVDAEMDQAGRPDQRKPRADANGEVLLTFGKFEGKKLSELSGKYLEWMAQPEREFGAETTFWQDAAREELERRRQQGDSYEEKPAAIAAGEQADAEVPLS